MIRQVMMYLEYSSSQISNVASYRQKLLVTRQIQCLVTYFMWRNDDLQLETNFRTCRPTTMVEPVLTFKDEARNGENKTDPGN